MRAFKLFIVIAAMLAMESAVTLIHQYAMRGFGQAARTAAQEQATT